MSTAAQCEANRLNAQHSTGPRTPEGKAIACQNNFRHGFCGAFSVLPTEDQQEFDNLLDSLREEHQPSTPTENILVDRLAQHYWLGQRAQLLQQMCFDGTTRPVDAEKSFALYLRYQTTNDRAFSKCLSDLLKLKAEKRKIEIGFERQKQQQAVEQRKTEAHQVRLRIANAKAEKQELANNSKSTVQAQLPGHTDIPFRSLQHASSDSVERRAEEMNDGSELVGILAA